MNLLYENREIVLALLVLLEFALRYVPTKWNVSIIDNAIKFIRSILPSNRKRTADSVEKHNF